MKRILKAVTLAALVVSSSQQVFGADQPQISQNVSKLSSTESMRTSSVKFLAGLSDSQRSAAMLPFNSDYRSQWRYLPEGTWLGALLMPERKGLQINRLSKEQLYDLSLLLNSGLSKVGTDLIEGTVEAEKDTSWAFRGFINKLLFKYGPENYFVTIFGSPTDSTWAWRFEGHHLSLNFTVQNGVVTASPIFLGANPAHVTLTDGRQVSPLNTTHQYLQTLVISLSESQLKTAKSDVKKVPKFNVYAPGLLSKKLKIKTPAAGLPLHALSEDQQKNVVELLESYQTHLNPESARLNMALVMQNLDTAEVVWFGKKTFKAPFYFRIQSKAFVFEMMSSENDHDHYHSVWLNL